MPELPEVETTLRGIAPHVVGRKIREVIVRERRLRWPVPAEVEELAGQRIESARRRGKYLLLRTARGTLLLHLGMSGSLRVIDPASPWRKHDHLAFQMESGRQLRFHDPRRFGCALLLPQDDDSHPLLRDLGPEPLGDDFSADYLFERSRGKSIAVKHFIMDSKVVVGVGNIYACESLFIAGIRPTKAARRVTRESFSKLVTAIRKVLFASIERGGTTLRDFLREDGEPGYFKQSLRVYDRKDQPCLRCKTAVKRIVSGQRSTFFCPNCQK
jgi:formamidopyrimidine-DNA glycosylase